MSCKLKKNDINDTIENLNDYKVPTIRECTWFVNKFVYSSKNSCYLSVNNNPTFIKGLKRIHVLKKVMLHKKKKHNLNIYPKILKFI